jgi:hypothetical protein
MRAKSRPDVSRPACFTELVSRRKGNDQTALTASGLKRVLHHCQMDLREGGKARGQARQRSQGQTQIALFVTN